MSDINSITIPKILAAAVKQFDNVILLNSNGSGRSLLALGNSTESICEVNSDRFLEWRSGVQNEWCFGFFSYDFKNELEKLESKNPDNVNFPTLYFFVPEVVYSIEEGKFLKGNWSPEVSNLPSAAAVKKVQWRLSQEEYVERINKVLEHIHHGDIYEMNFCHEFYSDKADLNPVELYNAVNSQTEAPFSSFVKIGSFYSMGGSPERFLQKSKNKLMSQPIKGTARRGKDNEEDLKLIEVLKNDPKERSENIMIVDLVRNDLSKTAKSNSVKVDELCQIHTFSTVHQMISTVSSTLDDNFSGEEALLGCFPMGSMTGAPKIEAMKLIERYETTKRGLYSGAIGYFSPDQDFDFNVVIRTLFYNSKTQYLSGMVGGAITSQSNPIQEYKETKLKAAALLKAIEICTK